MAYEKSTWVDETLSGNERYDIATNDGTAINSNVQITLATPVAVAGTAVDAAKMNHIEQGIAGISIRLIDNAGAHNSIYRGISLGTSVSAAQFAAIAAGTFEDMYIGDYWTIGGVVWRIWHFNYYYNVGDVNCTTPHVTIVPDTCLYNAQMNATDVVTGAYAGSAMYTTNLATAKTTINTAFGAAHILNHRILLANAVSGAAASGWAWYDSIVELMTEHQVYGTRAFGAPANNGYGIASQDGQFAAASLHHAIIHNRNNYWLQDVVSAANFAIVDNAGRTGNYIASASFGVRPAFSII